MRYQILRNAKGEIVAAAEIAPWDGVPVMVEADKDHEAEEMELPERFRALAAEEFLKQLPSGPRGKTRNA